jgi:hypothetical protein
VRVFIFAPDPTPSKFLKLVEVCMAGVRDRILEKKGKEMMEKILTSVSWEGASFCEDSVGFINLKYRALQYSTVQYSIVQYSTVQYSTVQYSTVQYTTSHHITSHHTAPHRTAPHHTILHHTTSHHTAPHHTTPHHTTPHHTTPHHTTQHSYLLGAAEGILNSCLLDFCTNTDLF